MTIRQCLILALVLALLNTPAVAQVSGTTLPPQQEIPEMCKQVRGTLGSGVLQLELRYLSGLVSEAALKILESEMRKRAPEQGTAQLSTSGGLAALYLDPATTEREEGQGRSAVKIGAKTAIQIFGERQEPIPKTDPCAKYAKNGVLTIRVAMPETGAKSIQDILSDDQAVLSRSIIDLGKLEIVAVPMISRPDKDNPCECEEGKSCVRVSTLTLVPSKVFEEKKVQPTGASTASFAAYPSDLRQEKQRLEKEAASLIEWLRASQSENQLACFSDDKVLLWAEDVPDALKRWSAFWNAVASRTQQLKMEEDANRKNLPAAPPAVTTGDIKPVPVPPKIKKSGM
jgi:hypothetical protein